MDISAYSYNDEYGSDDAGRVLFNGTLYTPQEVREFAQNLTDLADMAETYLPEEETQWYKEEQATSARLMEEQVRTLYYDTPLSRYVTAWEEAVAEGKENPFDIWLEQSGDRIALVKDFIQQQEATRI